MANRLDRVLQDLGLPPQEPGMQLSRYERIRIHRLGLKNAQPTRTRLSDWVQRLEKEGRLPGGSFATLRRQAIQGKTQTKQSVTQFIRENRVSPAASGLSLGPFLLIGAALLLGGAFK